MTDKKEVTQEDRQRAADYYGQFGEFSDLSQACSEGLTDGADFGLVQAFAAHRIAAEQKAKAHWLEVAKVVRGFRKEAEAASKKIIARNDASLKRTQAKYDGAVEVAMEIECAIRSLGEQE